MLDYQNVGFMGLFQPLSRAKNIPKGMIGVASPSVMFYYHLKGNSQPGVWSPLSCLEVCALHSLQVVPRSSEIESLPRKALVI